MAFIFLLTRLKNKYRASLRRTLVLHQQLQQDASAKQSSINNRTMNELRRNEDSIENKCWYHKTHYIK